MAAPSRIAPTTLAAVVGFLAVLHPGAEASAQVVEVESPVFSASPAFDESAGFDGSAEPAKGGEPDLGRRGPPTGRVYAWDDGGRTRRVYLQEDLVVAGDGDVASSAVEVERAPGGPIVRVAEASRAADGGLPVFRSRSGALMTLPGGVVLVLDAGWARSRIDAFFAANGIERDRISPLGEIPNGFAVETAPGFPSLELANALAGLEGVRLASPNWWRELVAK